MTQSDKAKLLCSKMWLSTVDYSEATNSPQTLGFQVYIWTALYYSILDIIKKNNFEYEMRKAFIETTCQCFNIDLSEESVLNSMLQVRQLAIEQFSEEAPFPLTQTSLLRVHHIALIHHAIINKIQDPPAPTNQQEVEFLAAVLHITKFAAELLAKPDVPSAGAFTQAVSEESHMTSKFGSVVFVVFVLLFLSFFIFLASLGNHDTSTRVAIETTTTQPVETEKALVEVARPVNGHIFSNSAKEGLAPLEIKAPYSRDCYYVLKSLTSASGEIKFYGRSSQTVELLVPLGSYELYYATGDTWYGRTHLFGEDTVYQKCDTILDFTEEPEGYSGWTIELNLVTYGNLDTETVSEANFPK